MHVRLFPPPVPASTLVVKVESEVQVVSRIVPFVDNDCALPKLLTPKLRPSTVKTPPDVGTTLGNTAVSTGASYEKMAAMAPGKPSTNTFTESPAPCANRNTSAFTVPNLQPSISKGSETPPPVAGEFIRLTLVTCGCASIKVVPKHSQHTNTHISRRPLDEKRYRTQGVMLESVE